MKSSAFCVSYFLKVVECNFPSFDGSQVFAGHHRTSAPLTGEARGQKAGAKGEMNEYLMNEQEFPAESHLPASLDLTARRSRAGRRPFSERHQCDGTRGGTRKSVDTVVFWFDS